MLLLPKVLVTFVLAKKCTPFELHKEIKRCIAENLHGFTDDNCKHLLEWCLAAGQSTSATKCAPVLALKFKPVMTSNSTFAEWCVHCLASTIGPRRVQATAATRAMRGSPAITNIQTQSQVTPNELATQEMVKSVKLMAELVMKMSDKNVKMAEQAAERAVKKDATEFTQYMEAALMGWAGVTAKQSIPRLWIKFLTSKRMDDHRLNLHRRMKELAKQKEMKFEQHCYFPDKMLKDILEMSPNAGGNIPTLASLGRGNTIGA